jgi:carbon-monoxide dehydrogenase large subunit
LWLTTQRPHNIRDLLASYMQLPHDRVRVIQPRDMGSAFGSKAPFYREEIVASHLAMKLGQPVRWIENRMESLMNVGQERDQIHYVDAALRKDGTLLAVRDRIIANCGDGQVGIYAGFAMPHLGAMYLVNGNDLWAYTSIAAISLVPWTRRRPLSATRPFALNRPRPATMAAI